MPRTIYGMIIQKRSMNWLPKRSLYNEAAYKAAKQKAAHQAFLGSTSGITDTVTAINVNQVKEMGNITSNIVLARLGIKKSG
jgi:hypothetical protein